MQIRCRFNAHFSWEYTGHPCTFVSNKFSCETMFFLGGEMMTLYLSQSFQENEALYNASRSFLQNSVFFIQFSKFNKFLTSISYIIVLILRVGWGFFTPVKSCFRLQRVNILSTFYAYEFSSFIYRQASKLYFNNEWNIYILRYIIILVLLKIYKFT